MEGAECADCKWKFTGEAYFSKSQCEICGECIAGDREDMIGHVKSKEEGGEDLYFDFAVCQDCVYFNEYRRLDDQTMERVKQSSES